jgi:hypothetical protein
VRNGPPTPFVDRPLKVNAEFDCAFSASKGREIRIRTRGEICDLLAHAREQRDKHFIEDSDPETGRHLLGSLATSVKGIAGGITNKFSSSATPMAKYLKSAGRDRKMKFWKKVTKCSFAIAPPGFGMDTHRFWEILQMHAVPIVITSPLDELYSKYPVIIVKRWGEIFIEGALEKYKKDIIARFGANPFNDDVMQRLTIEHWANQVHAMGQKE